MEAFMSGNLWWGTGKIFIQHMRFSGIALPIRLFRLMRRVKEMYVYRFLYYRYEILILRFRT